MKILIADDDPIVRHLLSAQLKELGHHVDTGANGAEALRHCQAESYDLAITDIFMPELDGIELLSKLRRMHPKMRIIAISGNPRWGADYLKMCKQLGADAALEKPFTITQLTETIASLVPLPGQ